MPWSQHVVGARLIATAVLPTISPVSRSCADRAAREPAGVAALRRQCRRRRTRRPHRHRRNESRRRARSKKPEDHSPGDEGEENVAHAGSNSTWCAAVSRYGFANMRWGGDSTLPVGRASRIAAATHGVRSGAYPRPMDDVPDLRDSSGRMKRIILALTVAVIVGAAVYGALYAFARPDDAAAAHAEGISVVSPHADRVPVRVLFHRRRGHRRVSRDPQDREPAWPTRSTCAS